MQVETKEDCVFNNRRDVSAMEKNSRIVPKTSVGVFLTICSIVLLVVIAIPVQACYDPETDFATEVLLNKPGVSYDLPTLRSSAEEASMKIVEIEDKHDWELGTYYVYPSHFNSELEVIIHEVKDWWADLVGLSLRLAIPTEWSEVTRKWDTATLELDFEIELSETLIDSMEMKGYEVSGEGVVDGEMVMLVFSKNDIAIYVSSGVGSKRPEGQTDMDNSVIRVEGPVGSIDYVVDEDLRDMLGLLSISPDEWDNAAYKTVSYTDWELVPGVDVDPAELDWGTAMLTELEWMNNKSIVKGLTAHDVREIGMKAKAGHAGWNSRIVYEKGTWMPYDETGDPMLVFGDCSGTIPTGADGGTPIGSLSYYLAVVGVVGTLVVFLATYSYTRNQKKKMKN